MPSHLIARIDCVTATGHRECAGAAGRVSATAVARRAADQRTLCRQSRRPYNPHRPVGQCPIIDDHQPQQRGNGLCLVHSRSGPSGRHQHCAFSPRSATRHAIPAYGVTASLRPPRTNQIDTSAAFCSTIVITGGNETECFAAPKRIRVRANSARLIVSQEQIDCR